MPHFNQIKKFIRGSAYMVQQDWKYLEDTLIKWNERTIGKEENGLDLDPDFQRHHVWTPYQQARYVEYALRGGTSGRDIYFNNPTWQGSYSQPTVLVDGKQRLEAARRFMTNKLCAFGHYYEEWEGRIDCSFNFHVNSLKTRREVLQWYLDLNTGGTPHTANEIARVEILLDKEPTVTQPEGMI